MMCPMQSQENAEVLLDYCARIQPRQRIGRQRARAIIQQHFGIFWALHWTHHVHPPSLILKLLTHATVQMRQLTTQ